MRKLGLLLAVGTMLLLTGCSSKVKLKDTAMTQMFESYEIGFKPEMCNFVEWGDDDISEQREFLGSDLYFIRGEDSMTGFMFFKTEAALEKFVTQLPDYVKQVTADGYAGGKIPDWSGIWDNSGDYAGISRVVDMDKGWRHFNLFTFEMCEFGDDNPLVQEGYIDTGCMMRMTTEYRSDLAIRIYLGMDVDGTYLYPAVKDMTDFAKPYISEYIRNGEKFRGATSYPADRELKVKCKWKNGKFTYSYDE